MEDSDIAYLCIHFDGKNKEKPLSLFPSLMCRTPSSSSPPPLSVSCWGVLILVVVASKATHGQMGSQMVFHHSSGYFLS